MRSSRRDHSSPLLAAALVSAALFACRADAPPGAELPPDTAAAGVGTDTGRALQLADPALFAACDSIARWFDGMAGGPVERVDGRFTGTVRGAVRYGCRISVADTLQPGVDQRPMERIWQILADRGWQGDPAWEADGPEGAMVGLRDGTVLCVLQQSWFAGSDDERAGTPEQPVRYEMSAECFREPVRTPARP